MSGVNIGKDTHPGTTRRSFRKESGQLVALQATGKLEGSDARAPVERAAALQIFGCVPEGAVIDGINADAAVITPPIESSCLRAAAVLNDVFSLHLTQRISRHAARITNRGQNAAARGAVTQGNIAHLVHSNAAHPAMDAVDSRESSLLEHSRSSIRVTQFIPTDGRNLVFPVRPDRYGMIDHQRLNAAAIAISQAIHQSVAKRVELLRRSRLRNAGPSSATRYIEGGNGYVGWPCESRVGRCRKIHVELPQVK